jgi:DNA topoisomerase I
MRSLGHHPETGEEITVRRGPYGLYVQQGETPPPPEKKGAKAVKPRRTSLPRGMDGDSMTLEQGIGLLGLPRLVGLHPETQERMEAGIGRFGPYVRMGAVFGSLDRDDDVLALGVNRAVDLLAKKLASVRTLGDHPADKELVSVRKGRFGPYVQHGKMVANVPRGVAMDDMTLDQAVALLAEKGKVLAPRGAKGRKGKPTRMAAAKPEAAEAPAKVVKLKPPPAKKKAVAKKKKKSAKAPPKQRAAG